MRLFSCRMRRKTTEYDERIVRKISSLYNLAKVIGSRLVCDIAVKGAPTMSRAKGWNGSEVRGALLIRADDLSNAT